MTFYAALLGQPGDRVSENRHYFDCGIILAIVGHSEAQTTHPFQPIPDYFYFAVDDLDASLQRAREAGAVIERDIASYPWGERSFYARDPWDNRLCIVDEDTTFTGGRFVP